VRGRAAGRPVPVPRCTARRTRHAVNQGPGLPAEPQRYYIDGKPRGLRVGAGVPAGPPQGSLRAAVRPCAPARHQRPASLYDQPFSRIAKQGMIPGSVVPDARGTHASAPCHKTFPCSACPPHGTRRARAHVQWPLAESASFTAHWLNHLRIRVVPRSLASCHIRLVPAGSKPHRGNTGV